MKVKDNRRVNECSAEYSRPDMTVYNIKVRPVMDFSDDGDVTGSPQLDEEYDCN